jgi:hypothetical protein
LDETTRLQGYRGVGLRREWDRACSHLLVLARILDATAVLRVSLVIRAKLKPEENGTIVKDKRFGG